MQAKYAGKRKRPDPSASNPLVDPAFDAGTLPGTTRDRARSSADSLTNEYGDVLAVINELEDQLDRYEEIRATLEHQLDAAREQDQSAQQRVRELEQQVVTLQAQVVALELARQEVAMLEDELASANARTNQLSEQLAQVEKENSRINAELTTARQQIDQLGAAGRERDTLRIEIRKIAAKLGQLERTHQAVLEKHGLTQMKLEEAQAALEETRVAKGQIEIELGAAADRNVELRRAQDDLQERLDAARAERKDLLAQLAHAERENVGLIERRHSQDRELASLRGLNRNTELALANIKKAFGEVRAALTETRSRARRRAKQARRDSGSTQPSTLEETGYPSIAPASLDAIAETMSAVTGEAGGDDEPKPPRRQEHQDNRG